MTAKKFPVEAGHIMMFARSVGDDNRIYHDEEYAASTEVGGVVAPPTFVQASAQFDPDYFLRPQPGLPWFGSGKEATGIKRDEKSSGDGGTAVGSGGGLHAEQHYEYHRQRGKLIPPSTHHQPIRSDPIRLPARHLRLRDSLDVKRSC